MDRRRFAVLCAAAAAGCQTRPGESVEETTPSPDTPSDTPAGSPPPSSTRTSTDTQSPTDTPACPTAGARRVTVGTSVRPFDWTFTVQSVTLTRTYRLDGGSTTRTLPSGDQFVIVRIDVTNRGEETNTWFFDEGFQLVTPDCSTPRWLRFLEIGSESVPISDLRRVEHLKQFRAQVGYPLDPGGNGTMWYVTLVDASLDKSDISVLLSSFDTEGFPVQWLSTV